MKVTTSLRKWVTITLPAIRSNTSPIHIDQSPGFLSSGINGTTRNASNDVDCLFVCLELVENYEIFETEFLSVLNNHAHQKKKVIKGNHVPYMTRPLQCKAIMKKLQLEKKAKFQDHWTCN